MLAMLINVEALPSAATTAAATAMVTATATRIRTVWKRLYLQEVSTTKQLYMC